MENINYSTMIVSMQTKDGDVFTEPHDRILNIGNQNLKDFNERMETNTVLDYDYVNKSFKIHRNDNNARIKYLSTEFVNELNRYITLDRNPNFDQKFIKNEYVKRIRTNFNDLQQEIRFGEKLKDDGLSQREKEQYLNTVEELIKLRKDSYPKVVLSKTEIIDNSKSEINELCADLSKELVRKE
jgi:hypothetical protein